jgi:nucleoid-associated protein YgaU
MSYKNQQIDSREEIISMFLGLAVVVIVALFLINFIQRRKGTISLPGISTNQEEEKIREELNSGNYVVEKNDSLWNIAQKKYGDGYKWTVIAKENELNNPGLLEVGQTLKLPKIESTIVEKEEVTTEYTVKKGDSLWKISVANLADGYQWPKVWELNKDKIRDPNELEIGMVIKLR